MMSDTEDDDENNEDEEEDCYVSLNHWMVCHHKSSTYHQSDQSSSSSSGIKEDEQQLPETVYTNPIFIPSYTISECSMTSTGGDSNGHPQHPHLKSNLSIALLFNMALAHHRMSMSSSSSSSSSNNDDPIPEAKFYLLDKAINLYQLAYQTILQRQDRQGNNVVGLVTGDSRSNPILLRSNSSRGDCIIVLAILNNLSWSHYTLREMGHYEMYQSKLRHLIMLYHTHNMNVGYENEFEFFFTATFLNGIENNTSSGSSGSYSQREANNIPCIVAPAA